MFYERTDGRTKVKELLEHLRPTASGLVVVSLGSKQATFFVDGDSDGFIMHEEEGKRKGSQADVDFH